MPLYIKTKTCIKQTFVVLLTTAFSNPRLWAGSSNYPLQSVFFTGHLEQKYYSNELIMQLKYSSRIAIGHLRRVLLDQAWTKSRRQTQKKKTKEKVEDKGINNFFGLKEPPWSPVSSIFPPFWCNCSQYKVLQLNYIKFYIFL